MELSSRMGRKVDPKIADACETAAGEFLANLAKGLMPINRPEDIHYNYAAEFAESMGTLLPEAQKRVNRAKRAAGRNVDLVWVRPPKVTNVAIQVRDALRLELENEIDQLIWHHFAEDRIRGNEFDVYEYYAKLRFTFLEAKEWMELGDELRDGFVNMARQDVTEAIQNSIGY